MALQSLGTPLLLSPGPTIGHGISLTATTVDAAGESVSCVGYIRLSSGPGTSKVLSAAGSGKIHVCLGALTFANGSTNVRVGVNDVDAAGVEDGTHDVYGDFVGGGGGLSANGVNNLTMTSGTKTIADGDLVAIVVEMTARGGADSVVVNRATMSGGSVLPYATVDAGSGPAKAGGNGAALCAIEFDDGTIGYMANMWARFPVLQTAFASNSTPDEYALVFQVPFKARVSGLFAGLGNLAAADDFELILYSDPLGTPVAELTAAQDMTIGDGQIWISRQSGSYTLSPGTNYAIAIRPTTTNTLSFYRFDLGTGGANLRKACVFGTNCSTYYRQDNAGAFGNESTTSIPMLGVWIDQLDDGVSAGGGGGRRPRLVTVS
jgi:hypothetical protein